MKRTELKQLIKETVKSNLIEEAIQYNNLKNSIKNLVVEMLNEVDWEKFADVSKVCLSAEEVASRLNAELERLKVPSSKRPAADIDFPKISKGNIPVDEQGIINVEQFKTAIMQLPATIFDEGLKSKHTIDEDVYTVNTGIPALRAVLWDEQNNKFFIINTCPGAGKCIKNCYAMQGFYIMNDGKNMKLINRLQLMMNHPDIYENKAYNELELYAFKANRENKKLEIRWNDAGDIFSKVYFDIIVSVTNRLKSRGYNVESYAYTKVGAYMQLGQEHGVVMSFSTGATTKQKEKVDMSTSKLSETVPYDLFKDLFERQLTKDGKPSPHFAKDDKGKTKFKNDIAGRIELKNRIYQFYKDKEGFQNLTVESLKFTDELPSIMGNQYEYNAIILPAGDSDRPAQRKDVRITFLCEH